MNKAQWVLASQNKGKCLEIQELVGQHAQLRLLSEFTQESVEETAATFVENALIKARFAAEKTGLPALADDSGLVVDALNGEPGVRSARYAQLDMQEATDKANIHKLLQAMRDVPKSKRMARFVCVLVWVSHPEDPLPLIAQGLWQGFIHDQSQGEQGFGYDPVFFIPEFNKTSAELSALEKNQYSHRAKAWDLFEKLWQQRQN